MQNRHQIVINPYGYYREADSRAGLDFCHYLEAVFDHVDTTKGMMDVNVARVRRRLSEEFEQVIERGARMRRFG
jgi:hypothetical protein